MKFRICLAIAALMLTVSSADAVVYDFTLNDNGQVGQTSQPWGLKEANGSVLQFELSDGALSNGFAEGAEIVSPFSVTYQGGDMPVLTLSDVRTTGNGLRFQFRNGADLVRYFFPVAGTGIDGDGNLLPFDSLETTLQAVGGDLEPARAINGSLSIVPEPSAFGFGLLALSVAGLGRWTKRRFFAKK